MTALREIHVRLMQNRAWAQYKPSVLLMLRVNKEKAKEINPTTANTRKKPDLER